MNRPVHRTFSLIIFTVLLSFPLSCMPDRGGDDIDPGLEPFESVFHTIATHREGHSSLHRHPLIDHEIDGDALIFYSATDYETGRKDNFWYEVIPDPDDSPPFDSQLRWERGNDDSLIRIRDTIIGIPPWIQVSYREIHHRENADQDVIDLPDYPAGWTGIVITEVLGHISNGDDDHGYLIDTAACRSTDPRVHINHGFDSNAKNDLVVRVTQLRWRSTLNIAASCERVSLSVTDGYGTRIGLPEHDTDPDSYLIPQLTTYWPHELSRDSGSGADDDMSYEYRVGDGVADPYLEGRYTDPLRT